MGLHTKTKSVHITHTSDTWILVWLHLHKTNVLLTSILCRLKASLSSDVAAFPRNRWGNILTGKSLSSSNPNEESQRSSESLESVLLVAADEQEEPRWCCCCLWNETYNVKCIQWLLAYDNAHLPTITIPTHNTNK